MGTVVAVTHAHSRVSELVGVFAADGHLVTELDEWDAALESAARLRPGVIVVDEQLARVDAYDACRTLRTLTPATLVVVSEGGDEVDELLAFAGGADDYLRLPCAPRVLRARLVAALRRGEVAPSTAHAPQLRVGPLTIDMAQRRAEVDGRPLHLTRIEFELLHALASDRHRVLSRGELLQRVWGPWPGDDHVVEVHLSRLRAKIVGAGGPRIGRAVPGVGYTLGCDSAQAC